MGGVIQADIIKENNGKAELISVDMGKAIFKSRDIPVDSDEPEFIGQMINAGDKEYKVNCVSVGNPHCVVVKDSLDIDEIKKYGPLIENHVLFPNRINVQFAQVTAKDQAQILIWERGAGYTLASGSSSSAAAAVAYRLGLCDSEIAVHTPGGKIDITVSNDFSISMTGSVTKIAEGTISTEMFSMSL